MEGVAAQTISSGAAYLWPLVREVPDWGVGLLFAEPCPRKELCGILGFGLLLEYSNGLKWRGRYLPNVSVENV